MKLCPVALCIFILGLSIHYGAASKGLFITTWGTRSHESFYVALMKALVEHGHEITFVTPHESEKIIKNVTRISLKEDFTKKIIENPFKMGDSTFAINFLQYIPQSCSTSLKDPGVQEALKEEYDYVILQIIFAECFLTVPFTRKIPFMYVTPTTLTTPNIEHIGIPDFTSITPNILRTFVFPFSLTDRLSLTFESLMAKFFMEYLTRLTYNKALEEELWPSEAPDVFDLKYDSSLTIINSVRALEYPMRPMPPNVIYAGGIHISQPEPLPQDLQEWLDGSGDDGFIFFSLGTGVKPQHMDPNHLSILVEVFGSLKQRVIWKWSSNLIDLPPNVKAREWLPQQGILAHPKIKLLISHGGIFSTQEATYYKVPVLGMPIYYDQHMNVAEIVKEGWGRSVKWKELTRESLTNAIHEVLTNTSLRELVQRRSLLMRDAPRKPKDEVSFWVDYVTRNKGAKHLQSPFVGIPWYKMYNIDVWIFFVACHFAIFTILASLTKFFIKYCITKFIKLKRE